MEITNFETTNFGDLDKEVFLRQSCEIKLYLKYSRSLVNYE
jgi:hypothetical protein